MPRSRLFPDKAYRGFIPSKRVYFHGPKLHLLVDDGKFIHEVSLTPGSLHDLSSLLLLPLDLPEGAELYLDRGYESHFYGQPEGLPWRPPPGGGGDCAHGHP